MSKFLKCLISVVIAANLLITPQLCIACDVFNNTGTWSSVSWDSCSGTGSLPGISDDVVLWFSSVTADSNISVASIMIAPGCTLDAGSYTITLSGAFAPASPPTNAVPITFNGTFNARHRHGKIRTDRG